MVNDAFDSNSRIGKALFVLLTIGSLFLIVKTVSAMKAYRLLGAGVPASNVITVSGKGEATAVPDVATISFSVVEQGATVKEAQDKATDRTNKALAFLKEKAIAEKDIQTSSYTVNPHYVYPPVLCTKNGCPPSAQKLDGYEVSQTITVKLRKVDTSGDILSGIGALGVQNVSGLNFSVDDENALTRQARQKAIADAKDKANALAKDLGVSLVRIVNFSESGNYPPIIYGKEANQALDARGSAVAPSPAPQIPAGENTITSNVTISYEIR